MHPQQVAAGEGAAAGRAAQPPGSRLLSSKTPRPGLPGINAESRARLNEECASIPETSLNYFPKSKHVGGGERGEGTGETEVEEREQSEKAAGRQVGGGKGVRQKIKSREAVFGFLEGFFEKPVSCPRSGKEISDNSKESWHHMAPSGAHGGGEWEESYGMSCIHTVEGRAVQARAAPRVGAGGLLGGAGQHAA